MKRSIKIIDCIVILIIAMIILLFFVRLLSEKQIDDVSPSIQCDSNLLNKADVFYVIPEFENQSIAEKEEWCQEILAMNKTLAMHGVIHTYKEFQATRDKEYLQEGINIFKECFNKTPEKFKAPQLSINKENRQLIKENGMKLDNYLNLLIHKVYHCGDSDKYLKNRFVDIF